MEDEGRDIDYERPLPASYFERGGHRDRVGGQWDELGELQLRFMIEQGLEPTHRLLDVGCGALRAGRRFADYLEPGGYYGIDINEGMLDAGYEMELSDDLRAKLPRDHLRATNRFDCDFGVAFDFAIANSLFTHISLNHIRLCLYRVAKVTAPGGRFLASYFEAPRDHPVDEPRGNGRLWTERNAFFYYRRDLRYAARGSPWELRYIGGWDHPRHQRMMEFTRIDPDLPTADPPPADPPTRVQRALQRVRSLPRPLR